MGVLEFLLWAIIVILIAVTIDTVLKTIVEVQKAKNPCTKEHVPEPRDYHGM